MVINAQAVEFDEHDPKATIYEVARTHGVHIPTLCYHPMLRPVGSCRVCLVELPEAGKMVPACVTRAAQGLVVETQTPQVEESIKSALSFLRCRHPNACMTCEVTGRCEFQVWS